MADSSKAARVLRIFESIAGDYDRANARISLGLHKSWKRMLIRRLSRGLPHEGKVLDLCCGTGDIAIALAKERSDLQVTGLDFSPAMLARAGERGEGMANLRFVQGDAMALPFPDESFSAAAISFGLRNTADYAQVLREMRRVTVSGGEVLCLDSFVPDSVLVKPFYRLYFSLCPCSAAVWPTGGNTSGCASPRRPSSAAESWRRCLKAAVFASRRPQRGCSAPAPWCGAKNLNNRILDFSITNNHTAENVIEGGYPWRKNSTP